MRFVEGSAAAEGAQFEAGQIVVELVGDVKGGVGGEGHAQAAVADAFDDLVDGLADVLPAGEGDDGDVEAGGGGLADEPAHALGLVEVLVGEEGLAGEGAVAVGDFLHEAVDEVGVVEEAGEAELVWDEVDAFVEVGQGGLEDRGHARAEVLAFGGGDGLLDDLDHGLDEPADLGDELVGLGGEGGLFEGGLGLFDGVRGQAGEGAVALLVGEGVGDLLAHLAEIEGLTGVHR